MTTEVGSAQGKIVIDTSDLNQVRVATQQVGQDVERNLGRISAGAANAEINLTRLARQVASAFGVTLGVAGVAQLARFAAQNDALATSYQRQQVAALSLAGSQARLNELMVAYDKATGGAVDRATALADVTRLQAVGFADSAAELERFTTVARGISIAMGAQQDYVISQLQLAIANQSTMRLDQLGLGVAEVTNRINELMAANGNMTKEMAYQEAILEIAEKKYGDLAKSVEANATGAERLRASWADLRLELGQEVRPGFSAFSGALADLLELFMRLRAERDEWARGGLAEIGADDPRFLGRLSDVEVTWRTSRVRDTEREIEQLQRTLAQAKADLDEMSAADSMTRIFNPAAIGDAQKRVAEAEAELARLQQRLTELLQLPQLASRTGIGAHIRETPTAMWPTNLQGSAGLSAEDELRIAGMQEQQRIAEDTAERINETERQYGQQRAQTVANYGLSMARQEEDFARQRARAAEQLAQNIERMNQASAAREAQLAADLSERLGGIYAQSAQRTAEWQQDHEERIADLRRTSGERLEEMEADYQRNRERAALGHRETLLSAAGRLDAAAVAAEQRRYAIQQQDMARDHAERMRQEAEQLDERISQEQATHAKRMERESRNLAERVAQEQAAHQKRLDEGRRADAQRLADLQAAYEEEEALALEERQLRLARQAEDHQRQLAQMDAAHGDRIAQIKRQEAKSLEEWEEAHTKALEEVGIYNEEWRKIQRTEQELALEDWDEWWKEFRKRFAVVGGGMVTDGYADGGPVRRTGPALVHAGEYVLNPRTTAALNAMMGGFDQNRLLQQVGGKSMSVTFADGAIRVAAAAGQSPLDVARAVRDEVADLFRELAV